MSARRKLWIGLGTLLALSFATLLWIGTEIHRVMPPLPARVTAEDGRVIYSRADIEKGRQVWQSIGGHQLGSIWGHGSYVAPDWTADWLHREAVAWLDIDAMRAAQRPYADLDLERQASLAVRLRSLIRTNTFDPQTRTIVVSNDRAAAMARVAEHYTALFGSDPELLELRKAYAMKNGTVIDAANRHALTAFVW